MKGHLSLARDVHTAGGGDLKSFHCNGTAKWITTVGGTVLTGLDGEHDFIARQDGRHRHHTTRQSCEVTHTKRCVFRNDINLHHPLSRWQASPPRTLAQNQYIWLHAVVVDRQHFSSAAQASLDLLVERMTTAESPRCCQADHTRPTAEKRIPRVIPQLTSSATNSALFLWQMSAACCRYPSSGTTTPASPCRKQERNKTTSRNTSFL